MVKDEFDHANEDIARRNEIAYAVFSAMDSEKFAIERAYQDRIIARAIYISFQLGNGL